MGGVAYMLKIIIAENISILISICLKIKWKHRNNNDNTQPMDTFRQLGAPSPILSNAGLSFNNNKNNNL